MYLCLRQYVEWLGLLLISPGLLLSMNSCWTNAMQLNLETKDFHLDHVTCVPVMQAIERLQHVCLPLQDLSILIEHRQAQFECIMRVSLEDKSSFTFSSQNESPDRSVAECIDRLVESMSDNQVLKTAS
jgi:hypothetical protein